MAPGDTPCLDPSPVQQLLSPPTPQVMGRAWWVGDLVVGTKFYPLLHAPHH